MKTKVQRIATMLINIGPKTFDKLSQDNLKLLNNAIIARANDMITSEQYKMITKKVCS